MENLNLDDTSLGGPQDAQGPPPLGPGPPPPNQQLPPQMFTTAAQLLDMTDKKLMVSLRDGRKLIGVLRSWDQFDKPGLFADQKRGTFLVRGENVLLLGEIDLDKDDDIPAGYEVGDLKLVIKLDEERKRSVAIKDKSRLKKLAELGFEGENSGETLL